MFILLLVVFGVLFFIGFAWINSDSYGSEIKYNTGWLFAIVGGFVSIICIFGLFYCGVELVKASTYEEKIEIYTEENEIIYNDIKLVVGEYLNWEAETYEKFSNTDITFVVNLYPDLKSNELIMKQIDVYLQNKNEIKMLKSQAAHMDIYRFWIYLG